MEERMQQLEQRIEALEQRAMRKKYDHEYYLKKKAKRLKKECASKLVERHRNPSKNTIFSVAPSACKSAWRSAPNLPNPLEVWTEKLKEFVAQGRRVDQYLEWLAWSWNHNTWVSQPVTKSGGRWAYYLGADVNGKARRQVFTNRDFTGHVKAHQTKFKGLHSDVIMSALWWNYGPSRLGWWSRSTGTRTGSRRFRPITRKC